MSQPGYPPPADTGERWAVNMPAVIGVVFVFLVGVIVWVVAGGDRGGEATGTPPSSTTVAPAALITTTTTGPGAGSTTPPPLPTTTTGPATTTVPATTTPDTTAATTTVPATTTPDTTAATTTVPATTTAPTTPANGTVGGDLGVDGTAMRRPDCDGSYITIIASAIGDEASAASIGAVLAGFPGSNYLRTDQTCPSLNPSADGEPIYVVYFGPFPDTAEACTARSKGSPGSYVRQLSTTQPSTHSVTC